MYQLQSRVHVYCLVRPVRYLSHNLAFKITLRTKHVVLTRIITYLVRLVRYRTIWLLIAILSWPAGMCIQLFALRCKRLQQTYNVAGQYNYYARSSTVMYSTHHDQSSVGHQHIILDWLVITKRRGLFTKLKFIRVVRANRVYLVALLIVLVGKILEEYWILFINIMRSRQLSDHILIINLTCKY